MTCVLLMELVEDASQHSSQIKRVVLIKIKSSCSVSVKGFITEILSCDLK